MLDITMENVLYMSSNPNSLYCTTKVPWMRPSAAAAPLEQLEVESPAKKKRWLPEGCWSLLPWELLQFTARCWEEGGRRALSAEGHRLKPGTGCCLALLWAWGRWVQLQIWGIYFKLERSHVNLNNGQFCCLFCFSSYSLGLMCTNTGITLHHINYMLELIRIRCLQPSSCKWKHFSSWLKCELLLHKTQARDDILPL